MRCRSSEQYELFPTLFAHLCESHVNFARSRLSFERASTGLDCRHRNHGCRWSDLTLTSSYPWLLSWLYWCSSTKMTPSSGLVEGCIPLHILKGVRNLQHNLVNNSYISPFFRGYVQFDWRSEMLYALPLTKPVTVSSICLSDIPIPHQPASMHLILRLHTS